MSRAFHLNDETIALQQKLARVQSLLEAARRVHSTIRLDDVLAGVLEIAAKELEADGAFFVSASPQWSARNGVYGDVGDDWSRWTEAAGLPGYSSAVLPGERGEPRAHLVVCRQDPLSLEEADFLEGLALQSALAIGNAQHHERAIEWERVKMDLDAARAIQRSLLPHTLPDVPGYTVSFRSTTCYEVGGDYVDAVQLPDGRMMIVLADVAGKGFASAMISTTFRSSFRAIAGAGIPLDRMAERLNTLHWLEGIEARRRYVTAVLLCLDPASHVAEVVNCGHNPAFFIRGEVGTERTRISASGPPLGMLPGCTYATERVAMPQGSQVLLYTDGLTEVFHEDEEFGEDRLLDLVPDLPAPDLLDHIWQTLTRYTRGARQTDDMTALHLYRHPGSNGITGDNKKGERA
jgi:serine phosphatase RsbU (regulator of sigma subunit)